MANEAALNLIPNVCYVSQTYSNPLTYYHYYMYIHVLAIERLK